MDPCNSSILGLCVREGDLSIRGENCEVLIVLRAGLLTTSLLFRFALIHLVFLQVLAAAFSAAAFILMTQDMRARLTSGCDANFETGKMMIRIGCQIYGNSLSFQLMNVCVAGLRFLRERLAACTLLFCLAYIDQLASTECVHSPLSRQ